MEQRVVDEEMRSYYDRRAHEYDDWWLGRGLYRTRDRPGWAREADQLALLLRELPANRVLDVACGTGFLTRQLRGTVTALDQSPQMVELARARLPNAHTVRGDAVPLPFADGAFDQLLTCHFYGHLLPLEREPFLTEARRVASALVVVDSARRPQVPAESWQERRLQDGSLHRVYKRFFRGRELAEEVGAPHILHEGRWFVVVAT